MHRKKFVLVCGLHRSGTSILFQSLKDHPQISGFENTGTVEDEGQHLQSAMPSDNGFLGTGRFAFCKDFHWTEDSPMISMRVRDKLLTEWGPLWDLNKEVLLEKSPPNIIHTRFLQALFPNSYFITIKRDPIATVLATRSFIGKKRLRYNMFHMVKHWCVAHDIYDNDKKLLKNMYELRYEDFVQEPDRYFKEICEFIGVQPASITSEIRLGTNDKYFSQWEKFKKGRLTGLVARFIERRFESEANKHGYSLINHRR